MSEKKNLILSIVGLFLCVALFAQEEEKEYRPLPLFAAEDVLSFKLLYDFDVLESDRAKKRVEHDALLVDPITSDTFKVEIKSRGGFRRKPENCTFSPLRFDFKPDDNEGTVFQDVNKIKFFAQCQKGEEYLKALKNEYLAYKLYQQLTPYSYDARLCKLQLVDITDQQEEIEIYGFFLEPDNILERRLEGKFLDLHHIDEFMLSEFETNLVAMFEFMIGNSDWMLYNVHNVELLSLKLHQPVPVPDDFDCSGFVDAPYAEPAPDTDLKDVKERYFRGARMKHDEFDTVYNHFIDKKSVIINCINSSDFLDIEQKEILAQYLESFYELLNDPAYCRENFLIPEE